MFQMGDMEGLLVIYQFSEEFRDLVFWLLYSILDASEILVQYILLIHLTVQQQQNRKTTCMSLRLNQTKGCRNVIENSVKIEYHSS